MHAFQFFTTMHACGSDKYPNYVTDEITKGYSDVILWVPFDVPSKGHIKHTEKGGDILNRKVLAVALTIIGIVVLAFAINVQAPAPSEPFTRYRFIVEIDGIAEMSFLEVKGLGVSVDVVSVMLEHPV